MRRLHPSSYITYRKYSIILACLTTLIRNLRKVHGGHYICSFIRKKPVYSEVDNDDGNNNNSPNVYNPAPDQMQSSRLTMDERSSSSSYSDNVQMVYGRNPILRANGPKNWHCKYAVTERKIYHFLISVENLQYTLVVQLDGQWILPMKEKSTKEEDTVVNTNHLLQHFVSTSPFDKPYIEE
ncbi:uncharacterized protein EV154DRAFT_475998 [Mucor mucedo]|uniref:uncharacterized protein n=1 Tax=Mucor mucedo TaxID=29922 RepID=UPI0022204B53|nr:uncharacterized protein EV154DRAFT_475998 [Mucor mucedo]KAI7896771.1 hypothetical protein EV154DRAFT_475998 [Mucor mucedo]